MKLLLDGRCDMHSCNTEDKTAMDLAQDNGHDNIVAILEETIEVSCPTSHLITSPIFLRYVCSTNVGTSLIILTHLLTTLPLPPCIGAPFLAGQHALRAVLLSSLLFSDKRGPRVFVACLT